MQKILILESVPVYALSTSAVAMDYIAALDYEAWDDPVEAGPFIVQWLPILSYTLFSRAKRLKILGSLRRISKQRHINSSRLTVAKTQLKKQLVHLVGV